MKQNERVCTTCGYVGKPVNQCFESFLVDLFIWLIVASVVIMTGFFPLFAAAIGWTIFHIVKFKNTKCPSCSNLDMVSKESNKGKAILEHVHQQPSL